MVGYFSKLRKHKAEAATAITEAVEAPVAIKYLNDLRGVASNPLVENGLKAGKIITYPIKPEIFPWPHIADTRGQMPMDTSYVTDKVVSGILNAAKDPVVFGAAVTAAVLTPLAVYGGYKAAKHAWPTAEKNVSALSSKVIPEFAHEKSSDIYRTIKRKLGK